MFRHIFVVLFLLAGFFSVSVQASPQFEFGKLDFQDCLTQSCTIKFKTDFKTVPYVFVMPTIGMNDWQSAPSSVRIMSRTQTEASFKQFIAPYRAVHNSSNGHYRSIKPTKMTGFHYLAIEKGVIDLGTAGKIVAGEVNTTGFYWQGVKWNDINKDNNDYGVPAINYSDFGFNSRFDNQPGILTQIQSTHNTYQQSLLPFYHEGEPIWLTSLGWHLETSGNRQKIKIAMDTSEVHTNKQTAKPPLAFRPQVPETIAFVAAEGSGFVNGKKFWMGSIETKNTHKDPENGYKDLTNTPQDNVQKPTTIACKYNSLDFVEDFPSAPVVLIGKNSRKGPNGGWIRRCQLTKDKVTVQIEEDLDRDSERKHASELTGVFIFEGSKQAPYCDLFPGPAQTWRHKQSLKYIAPARGVYIANNAQILGARKVNNERVLGFESISGQGVASGCDGSECTLNDGLIVSATELGTFPALPNALYPVDGNMTFTQAEHGVLGAVSVNKHATLYLNSGTYWFDSLDVRGDIRIRKGQKVIIHTKAMAVNNNSVVMMDDDSSLDNLLIYVHDKPFSTSWSRIHRRVDFNNNAVFRGLIYSEIETALSNNVHVYGAITTLSLDMHNNSIIHGESACFSSVEDYQISVTPDVDFSLTCDAQEVTFTVTNDGSVAENFDGQVRISTSLTKQGLAAWHENAGGTGAGSDASLSYTTTPQNGQVTLWLKSDYVGTINVQGEIVNDDAEPATAAYTFVPFKFDIDNANVNVVAGRPKPIVITARSCKSSIRSDVAKGYQGKRTLILNTRYLAPENGQQPAIQLSSCSTSACDDAEDWKGDRIDLRFSEGVAHAKLKYEEAGKTELTIADENCTVEKGCELLPATFKAAKSDLGDWKRLEGKREVWARPYTFALCNAGQLPSIEEASGTSERPGAAFTAAGREFQTQIRPVIWMVSDGFATVNSSMNALTDVDSSAMCQRQETRNFYHPDAPKTLVRLTHQLATPAAGEQGVLSGMTELAHTQLSDPVSLSWSEVGSIRLYADTAGNYLDMDVNAGYREVGRFYPAYVEIQNGNSYAYPSGQRGFAYLGQEFDARFSVLPKSQDGSLVQNYAKFSESLQVRLGLDAIDKKGISFGDRRKPLSTWRDWSNTTTEMPWKLERAGFNSAPLTTIPEAPWHESNSHWGLYIAEGVDPTGLKAQNGATALPVNGSALTEEIVPFANTPELRYGRMTLEDAAGRNDSPIAIPLRVEYWDGARFITNKDDSVSWFDGQYYCRQVVTQSDTSVISTSDTQGEGQVKDGETRSGDFIARPTPGVNYREQVRFWQKLIADKPSQAVSDDGDIHCENGFSGSNEQPWLTYDWRGLGDENPSALVTFGVYRGNDRVIYRGEKGINTMLN